MSPESLDAARAVAGFAVAYLAVLAAPGPNLLAIGTLAALRGLRGVAPFCLGIAAGAGVLAASLHLAAAAIAGTAGLDQAGRAVGGVLLLVIALRVPGAPAPRTAPGPAAARPDRRADGLAFGAGFLTAVSNPMTAAFFVAQLLGPLAEARAAAMAVLLVPPQALAWGLRVAALFARPAARRLALAWHRPACVTAGLALALLALATLRPLWLA